MREWEPTINRSVLFATRIATRTDQQLRRLVDGFEAPLSFSPIEDHLISKEAWNHVAASGYKPQFVFAHPEILMKHPQTSAYYRNMALLPLKRVSDLAVGVERWERVGEKSRVTLERATCVARL